jgi:SAM-dependent methyltransferase
MVCPVCFSNSKPPCSVGSNFSRCLKCKTIFAESLASQDQLVAYYENYYTSSNFEVPNIAVVSLNETVKNFSKYRTASNSICDIGFGAGALLEIAQKLGWKCAGSEYSTDAVEKGKENGWDVHLGDLKSDDLPGPFDILTIIETLEHVQNPQLLLEQARLRLRSGGLIYGTTPNSQSINAYLLKDRWSVITFPEHPIILSQKALKLMLKELGFIEISVQSRGLNPFDLLSSFSSDFNRKTNSNKQQLGRVDYGYSLNTKLSKNTITRLFKAQINKLLGFCNRGDTLVFSAVKP